MSVSKAKKTLKLVYLVCESLVVGVKMGDVDGLKQL